MVNDLPVNVGDPGLIPGSGRSPAEGNGNPLQYSWLGNPMDRGMWQTTVHGVTRVGHGLVTNHHRQRMRPAEKKTKPGNETDS